MIISLKAYPNAIITMNYAIYYYDLTNVISRKNCITTIFSPKLKNLRNKIAREEIIKRTLKSIHI